MDWPYVSSDINCVYLILTVFQGQEMAYALQRSLSHVHRRCAPQSHPNRFRHRLHSLGLALNTRHHEHIPSQHWLRTSQAHQRRAASLCPLEPGSLWPGDQCIFCALQLVHCHSLLFSTYLACRYCFSELGTFDMGWRYHHRCHCICHTWQEGVHSSGQFCGRG
jgi:hypothetical protein